MKKRVLMFVATGLLLATVAAAGVWSTWYSEIVVAPSRSSTNIHAGARTQITNTTCRPSHYATDTVTPAMVMVITNGIYYRLDSASATAVASNMYAATGDTIFVPYPPTFHFVSMQLDSFYGSTVAVTCLTQ